LCPRLETGLVVERLREARIDIENSPDIVGLGTTPYRLSYNTASLGNYGNFGYLDE
jgi:hypothetical protein